MGIPFEPVQVVPNREAGLAAAKRVASELLERRRKREELQVPSFSELLASYQRDRSELFEPIKAMALPWWFTDQSPVIGEDTDADRGTE